MSFRKIRIPEVAWPDTPRCIRPCSLVNGWVASPEFLTLSTPGIYSLVGLVWFVGKKSSGFIETRRLSKGTA